MSSRKQANRRTSRSIDIPSPAPAAASAVLNSPDEERTQAFDEYAMNRAPYSTHDDSDFSHHHHGLDTDHAIFVPVGAQDLAESNQVYRHASVHSAFSSTSPFVRFSSRHRQPPFPFVNTISSLNFQASYSSSPSTTGGFYKSGAFSASPPMMSIFGKTQPPEFQLQTSSPFASTAGLSSPLLSFVKGAAPTSPPTIEVGSTTASGPVQQDCDVPPLQTTELYHKVNPSFPTKSTPTECLDFFAKTMASLGFQYTIQQPWTVAVTGLLCVEEVIFSIQLKQDTDNLVADFHLQQGCERNFLRLFEIVRNHARSLDAQPLLSAFASSSDWLNVDSMPELFPGSSLVSTDTMLEYCEEYLQLAEDSATSNSTRGDAARLEMAACIKNACLADKNRALVIASPDLAVAFGSALYRMVQDDQLSIVRFAVFILSLFDVPSLVKLAAHVQVMLDGGMLSVLDKMESHDPIPKMKSIAASVRTKLVPTN